MSTLPIKSSPLRQAAQKYAEAMGVNQPADPPFYLVGFRNRILRLLKEFFRRPLVYSGSPDLPDISNLVYNPDNPTTLDIRATLADTPPATERCTIWVRTPRLTFEKACVGDRSTLEDDKAHQQLLKLFKGELIIMVDHPLADVPPMLLDELVTHLEGTKLHWIKDAGLNAFDITSISDGVEVDAKPVQVVRATLTAAYQGRLHLQSHVESLVLKRTEVSLNLRQ